jgi:hypothetical protein
VKACVATAPTPGCTQAQMPTPKARDCTATPSSPLASSRPMIEYVIEASLCNLARED